MSKKCLTCSDNNIYHDHMDKCPVCKSDLVVIDSGNSGSNRGKSNEHDPYSDLYNAKDKALASDTKKFRSIILHPENTQVSTNEDSFLNKAVKTDPIKTQNQDIVLKNPQKPSPSISTAQNQQYLEGIVRNFKEEMMPGFYISRWLRTLFMGVPFATDKIMNTFQVYSNWGLNNSNNFNCDEVVIYGRISRGKPNQDNTVRIWGKKDKSGSIVSSKILNLSSNTWLNVNHSISPIFAWIITIVFLLVIGMIINWIIGINWNSLFTGIISLIVNILVLIILLFIGFKFLKRFFSF